MKNLLSIIVIIALLPSCVTYKKCNRKFPPTTDTVTVVQKRDSIIIRDTTVFVTVQGETRIDSIKIPCPLPVTYKPDTVYAEVPLAKSFAYVTQRGLLRLHLSQKDTTISLRLENALKEAYYWESEYRKVSVTPQSIKYIPAMVKLLAWIGGVAIALILLFGVRKFLK